MNPSDYTNLTTWATNVTSMIQAIGFAIVIILLALIALIIKTSMGNEQKLAIAKGAAIALLIGFALFAWAPMVAKWYLATVQFMNPTFGK